MTNSAVTLRSALMFPVASAPCPGRLTICEGQIVAVGGDDEGEVIDLGDVAILPGLINAHVHLEFSDIAKPIGNAGIPLPDWIRHVVARRRAAGEEYSQQRSMAVRHGVMEAYSQGVRHLGEIATTDDWAFPAAMSATVFRELLTLDAEQAAAQLLAARDHLQRRSERVHCGLSPHAPYSTHPDLVIGACRLSAEFKAPVAMHLAESREELQLLADQTGPFRPLLEELGAWRDGVLSSGGRALDYLQMLARAHRALVIHGNYLNDEEAEYLAQHRDRLSLVYCPRTHAYFRHRSYPLAQLLQQGVRLVLATDSRASNPDLFLWEELKFCADRHRVAPEQLLKMVTAHPAAALDWPGGVLQVGRPAELTMVALAGRASHDPYDRLLAGGPPRPLTI